MSGRDLNKAVADVKDQFWSAVDRVLDAGGDLSTDPEVLKLEQQGNTLAAGLDCNGGVG